jgi:hypothetical protein
VEEMTEAKMIIAVVKGGEFSAFCGLNTVSIAKNIPETGALNPAWQFQSFFYIIKRFLNTLK